MRAVSSEVDAVLLRRLRTLLLMPSKETSESLNPQDIPRLSRGVGGGDDRTYVEKSVHLHLPFKREKKKKEKSPDSCANAISSAFVVEMRCKDGH